MGNCTERIMIGKYISEQLCSCKLRINNILIDIFTANEWPSLMVSIHVRSNDRIQEWLTIACGCIDIDNFN